MTATERQNKPTQLSDVLVMANMVYRMAPADQLIEKAESEPMKELLEAFGEFQTTAIRVIDEDLKRHGMTREDLLEPKVDRSLKDEMVRRSKSATV